MSCRNLGVIEAVILKFAKLQPVTDASMSYRAERGPPAPPRTKGRKFVIGLRCRPYMIA
jgi:hypothetical protein